LQCWDEDEGDEEEGMLADLDVAEEGSEAGVPTRGAGKESKRAKA
jgi:hypothetical protein